MILFHSLQDEAFITMLQNGKIGIIPTDTIYGLVAQATDVRAVQRLYYVKHCERKPGTLVATSVDQLVQLGLKRRYLKAVEHFWPGAVSVIIPTGAELDYLHQDLQGLAVRIPADEKIRDLLAKTGPLLTTSANQPGEKPASTVIEAQTYFGDKVDFYVDDGDMSGRVPSTVIRVVDDAIEVLRPGAVSIDELG